MNNKIRSIHCYEEKSWSAYHLGLLSEAKRLAMEEHLLLCDSCMSTYLSIIEEDNANKSVPMLSKNFTNRVMEAINIPAKKNKEVLTSRVTILISYCAAASMALFFWSGGYFESLAGGLTKGIQYIDQVEISQKVVEPERGFIQSGWSHKAIQENRVSFIDTIIPKKE